MSVFKRSDGHLKEARDQTRGAIESDIKRRSQEKGGDSEEHKHSRNCEADTPSQVVLNIDDAS